MIISVLLIIFLFIWFVLWVFFWIHLSSKRIKKLTNIIKNQTDSLSWQYKKYFEWRSIDYYNENEALKFEITNLKKAITKYRFRLSESYKSSEFVKFNKRIKYYKKKLKILYHEMPYYKEFVDFLSHYII
jgi:predicted PurR-regulated permease PerM